MKLPLWQQMQLKIPCNRLSRPSKLRVYPTIYGKWSACLFTLGQRGVILLRYIIVIFSRSRWRESWSYLLNQCPLAALASVYQYSWYSLLNLVTLTCYIKCCILAKLLYHGRSALAHRLQWQSHGRYHLHNLAPTLADPIIIGTSHRLVPVLELHLKDHSNLFGVPHQRIASGGSGTLLYWLRSVALEQRYGGCGRSRRQRIHSERNIFRCTWRIW